jgi:hypothetical protein
MVLMLFAAAQVYSAVVAVLHMQANGVLIELPAGIQIAHVKHHVAGPDDVEWRIEHMSRDGHTESLVRD